MDAINVVRETNEGNNKRQCGQRPGPPGVIGNDHVRRPPEIAVNGCDNAVMRAWLVVAASGAVYALSVLWSATQLPASGVPLHFGADGSADRFGSRAEALMSSIVVGALMLAITVAVVLVSRHGPLDLINVPHKNYWTAPERIQAFRRMLAWDIARFMSLTITLLSIIPIGMVFALRADPVGFSVVTIWLLLGPYLLGVALWAIWLARYRYRLPAPR